MSLCWGPSAYVPRGKFAPRISDVKCSGSNKHEHKPTDTHSYKDFQLSILVLLSSQKSNETTFLFHHFLADAVPNLAFLPVLFQR